MALYRAVIEIYVEADSEPAAQFEACLASTLAHEWDVSIVDDPGTILAHWRDAVPWGSKDGASTCAQVVARGPAEGESE
jgi:hypothetical protein